MKKITTLLFAAVAVAMSCVASVTITPSSRTFTKDGGANSILTSGSGTWTATTDVDWITLYSTSGNAGASCIYIVTANTTADTRIGHITIDGNEHTVSQTGYTSSISPQSATLTLDGGNGTVSVTTDAGVSWTAQSNDDWITIDTTSGRGPGIVTYTVAPYVGVASRTGTITISGKTFTITQTGTDVVLTPTESDQSCGACIVQFTVTALVTTKWTVSNTVSWITVLDPGNGFGESTIMLALTANTSSATRTATIGVGSKSYEIRQAGTSVYALSISPATSTATPTGSAGNFSVLATPDLPWTVQSLASWLTLSTASQGAGNDTVGYVASANPTLEPRSGQIKVSTKIPYPDVEIDRGLKIFQGTDYGTQRDPEVVGWTRGVWFNVTQSGTIHRLFSFNNNAAALYVNISDKLVFQDESAVHELDFSVTANTDYGLFIVCDGTVSELYAGLKDSNSYRKLYTFNGELFITATGTTTLPSSGSLVYGSAKDMYYYWSRPISEQELANHTTLPNDVLANASDPVYAKLYYYSSFKMGRGGNGALTSSGIAGRNRNNLLQNAMTGSIYPGGFRRYGLNKSNSDCSYYDFVTMSKTFYSSEGYFRNVDPSDAYTVNLWIKRAEGISILFMTFLQGYCNPLGKYYGVYGYHSAVSENCGLGCSEQGVAVYQGSSTPNGWYGASALTAKRWHMVTVTYTRDNSRRMTIYIDGVECGNTTANASYPYFYTDQWKLNGNDGDVWFDEIETFTECLSSAQVRSLYELEKPLEAVHTVTQGVITPSISTNEFAFAAAGGNGSVTATVAQNVIWTAEKDASTWVAFTSDTEVTGSGDVTFAVGPNRTVTNRVAQITVAGLPVTINQEGASSGVSYAGEPISMDGGMGTVDVVVEDSVYWTATSDASWITIISGSDGYGSGSVMFVADPSTLTSQSRTATITVAGKKVYVTQRGYELSISPQNATIGSDASSGSVAITASLGSVWEAFADSDWITITGSKTGVGPNAISYSVLANTSGQARTGRIFVSGAQYTITQMATLPLAATVVGGGSVSGTGYYDQGAVAKLIATPAEDYVFSHWSGDATGVTNELNVTVDAAKNVTASFIPKEAADQIVVGGAPQKGFYTRDQIHNLEIGNLVLDVDSTTGKARVGVQLQETSNLSDPNWQPVEVSAGDVDLGSDGTVGIKATAKGNAKFFRVVAPNK